MKEARSSPKFEVEKNLHRYACVFMGVSGYLRVAIRHILDNTSRRKSPATHVSGSSRALSDAVDGDINHSPDALSMLFAETEEANFSDWHEGRKNLQLGVHLRDISRTSTQTVGEQTCLRQSIMAFRQL